MHPAIEIKNLVKQYQNGPLALNDVSLNIQQGDFFALLGANGAGKTTMINVITGLVTKNSGQVKINGYDLDHQTDLAKLQIGIVPQEFNFSVFEKVIDIVITMAGFYGIPKSVSRPRAEILLKDLNLWEKRDVQAIKLSGGMKRRLMIARALVNDPKILILDEPTAGVDVELRHLMWDYLKKLNAEGKTILLTTHYLEEAEQLCRSVAIINKGEIIRNQSVKSLLDTMERHTVVLAVDSHNQAVVGGKFEINPVDENTLEVTLKLGDSVTELSEFLSENGIRILDFKPKQNRLEQLYLELTKK